ncbi:MAG: SpoIIE family protein phosphatase [Gomphosphaeria aponina SAG 52.96 = DSM 107014]|uniref:SpoIIE family protein phosphatase n=1 Tax=Gomphosphaeria aponina SAG 52.96 = DSM 107014 TaxID=1521640 RepID=A0A941GPH7_9CHRO|nr:SpoIIE family protein phosphatase [Gomphosphaeria aponina SAG 52.96 = DSM 107014]
MTQILIIDDDRTIRLILTKTLTMGGYEVAVASDGEEGLTLAQQLHPKLVICDWLMPRMNGLEVCRQLKATPALATTFFILLTGQNSVEDRVEGLDAGSDDFLCKPVDMLELKARVRAGLRLHQLSYELKVQKELLEAEFAEAAEYVSSMLPKPLNDGTVMIDFRFIPSQKLGGDIFDYFWLDSDHLGMYLLDVSGHGLRAALPSVSIINILRSQKLNKVNYYQPQEVLSGLNQTFQINDGNASYFTMWYGVYNRKKHQLVYASGGHPPAILFAPEHNGEIREQRLKTKGLPIGMFPDAEYHNGVCDIQPKSNLYIFSDGIYEITKSDGTVWGIDEFIKLLNNYQQTDAPNLDLLLKEVQNLEEKPVFDDDLSVMEIKFQ